MKWEYLREEEFKDAIKSLYAKNRLNGLTVLIKSLETQQARTEVANAMDYEYTKTIAGEDQFEETVPANDMAKITESNKCFMQENIDSYLYLLQ